MSQKVNTKPSRGHGGRFKKGEKAKDFKGTVKKLFSYLGKYRFSILVVILCAIGAMIFAVVSPKVLGNATTEIFNGIVAKIRGDGTIDFVKIRNILITVLLMYTASGVLQWLQGFIMAGVTQKISYRMRKELSEKIHRLPMRYFDGFTHGEILSRITNDVDTLSMGLNQSATQVIYGVVTIIGLIVMMLSISVKMTLVILCTVPLSLLFVALVVKHSQKYFLAQQKYLGVANGQVEEMYGGHTVLKAFNGEQRASEDFEKSNEQLYQSAWKSQALSGLMHPVINFVGNLGYAAVVIFGAYLAMKGQITVGNIQSFVQYVRSFTMPLGQIAQVSNMLQSSVAAAERIFEFLEAEEEEAMPAHPAPAEEIEGSVQFAHVHFGYKENKEIIHDFSANIPKGTNVAIVGPTGAGKTTIIKLLMRFYDVNEGAILADGYDLRDFVRSEYRSNIAMVLQDSWLFSGTVRENIRYGNLEASDEAVIKAAKAAHAHHFIMQLPDGYDTLIDEEATNISQGQKQLLTIARAFLADPKILILDEATSSVDTATEQEIQRAMKEIVKGRTTFVIAHRLSTIKNADVIFVLNNGDIVEKGNHEELMARGGFYAELYNSQFEDNDVA